MKYKLINSLSDTELEEKVNRLIAEGWEPVGGPVATTTDRNGERRAVLIQAMIKRRG